MPSTQKPLSNLVRQKMAMGMASHPVANEVCRTINGLLERVDALEQKGPGAPAKDVGQDIVKLLAMEDRITGLILRLDALEDDSDGDPAAEEKQPSTETAADEAPVDPAEIDPVEEPAPGLQPAKKNRRPHRRR